MKKSSFITMVLGTIGVIFLALGMCMAMLPEWNAFMPGVITGCIGLLVLAATVYTWRKMEGKTPIRLSPKTLLTALLGIAGALALGTGMSLTMVWSSTVLGIATGIVGIVMLLSLVPLIKGIN